MSTYSFLDVVAAISGPGGSINLAAGAGAAEEGITIEPINDQNVMTIGADGEGMHSLSSDFSVRATIRLLKTSPINAQLQALYNQQVRSSILHGRNTITVRDIARGDVITLGQAAFARRPTVTYAKEGGIMEWTFDAIKSDTVLGVGTPEI